MIQIERSVFSLHNNEKLFSFSLKFSQNIVSEGFQQCPWICQNSVTTIFKLESMALTVDGWYPAMREFRLRPCCGKMAFAALVYEWSNRFRALNVTLRPLK